MKLVNEHRVNVMVVGDGMVGKSSLVKCLLGRPFTQEYRTTVFLDRYEEVIQTDITKFILNITDFSMECEEIEEMPVETEDQIFVACYSVEDRQSFENMKSFWIPAVQSLPIVHPIILVATHVDMRSGHKSDHVTLREGAIFSRESGLDRFMEISCSNCTEMQTLLSYILSYSNNSPITEE